MINVLLVDDHALVRTGIRRLLNDVHGIKVYKEAETGEEALEAVREFRPDVVMMDVMMPGMGGIEATRRLAQTHDGIRVIILTTQTEEPYPTKLLRAGAMGYLSKGCSVDEMVTAIRRVYQGEPFLSSEIAQTVALSAIPGRANPFERLSARELQVMTMLAQGDKPSEISEKLHLSPKTISTYRVRVHEKLGVRTDAEMIRLAMRWGIIPSE